MGLIIDWLWAVCLSRISWSGVWLNPSFQSDTLCKPQVAWLNRWCINNTSTYVSKSLQRKIANTLIKQSIHTHRPHWKLIALLPSSCVSIQKYLFIFSKNVWYAKQKQPGAVKKGARPSTVESRVACGT